ncbi:growth inhibition and differentiation-related protein 88-like protein [Plakobranchus ocellatus]|uniref:Growth inhibition and differentiation-related protein 88-like protein n=1 Tax=Plakobranchus ocellatus TaxID=259542 RepID=A0AAV4AZD6_9GAST|nr:growth inhibition and differentiation-related protein 88-like protein [Plakobranchus ocellatus]
MSAKDQRNHRSLLRQGGQKIPFNLAVILNNRFLSIKDDGYTESVLIDLDDFYEKGNDQRVLVFPPLCSFNRLVIHKLVEANFPELATFSIGQGCSRRTVVAFKSTCERAGRDPQLMSEPRSKGRGRGRGKELTPNERVAQWVNQREARRLKKEKWSSREQVNTLSEKVHEEEVETGQKTENKDAVDEKEKSRSKRTPQVQLYVPPSLRAKMAQNPPSNSTFDQGEATNQPHSLNSCEQQAEDKKSLPLQTSDESPHIQVEPRGRGRGRNKRKPKVEVYVPRALRGVQKQNEDDHLSDEKSTPDSKICEVDGHDDTDSMDFYSEQDIKSLSQCSPSEAFPSQNSKNHFSVSRSIGAESLPSVPLSLTSEKDVQTPKIDPDPPDINVRSTEQANVFPNSSSPESTSVPTENSYTFEFYDPAVVAFMPSSPMPQAACNNVNNNSSDNLIKTGSNNNFKKLSDTSQNNSNKPSGQQLYTWKKEDNYVCSNDSLKIVSVSEPSVPLPNTSTPCSKPLISEEPTQKNENKCPNMSEAIHDLNKSLPLKPMLTSPLLGNVNVEESSEEKNIDIDQIEEDAEDSWDAMFDDNGDCLNESLMDELIQNVGNVEVSKPKINYLKFEPKEPDMDMQAFSHIVEIYDFSPELATCDLISAFRDFASRGFDVKWVDDTHALGVFSSAVAASEALQMIHPLLKVRPMSQASKQGQSKARHCQEFLQPYKARPETTSLAARRLVAGALGMAPRVSREVRDRERQKLKEAKEKRRLEKKQREDIWDGAFGKCAMDEV